MKRTLKSIAAVSTVFGVVAPSAFAGLTATLYAYQNPAPGNVQPAGYRDPNSVGGEFTAVLSGNSSLSSTILSQYSPNAVVTLNNGQTGFETFCTEYTVEFTPGTTYSASIGSTIVSGSGNAPLAQGVAWLYMQFATGNLATYASTQFGSSYSSGDYNYSVGSSRETCADELQNAIWYLQGEVSGQGTDPFVELVEKVFGNLSTAEESTTATGASNFGVDVLNLCGTNNSTAFAQDQLVYVGAVPEPSTIAAGAMLLLPLGWTTVRALRSRKNNG